MKSYKYWLFLYATLVLFGLVPPEGRIDPLTMATAIGDALKAIVIILIQQSIGVI